MWKAWIVIAVVIAVFAASYFIGASMEEEQPVAASVPSVEIDGSVVGWIIAGLVLAGLFWLAIRSGNGAAMLVVLVALLVFGGLVWNRIYRGADVATAEARDENSQVIRVIQPVGEPRTDRMNAETNNLNAKANATNAVGVAIDGLVFVIILFMVAFVFFVLARR